MKRDVTLRILLLLTILIGAPALTGCGGDEVDISGEVPEPDTPTIDEIPVEGDYRIKVTGAKASSEQPGSGVVSNSYDDDLTTLYHSHWTNTQFPVTIEYYFAGTEYMDYIEYVPRVEGTNGNFGKFTLSVATDAAHANYAVVGDYDFNESTGTSRVFFENSVKATAVKFEVHSGTGNFASCAEMRFWRKNTDKTFEKQLLEVFTDVTCTELKAGVDQSTISGLSSELFRNLALSLLNGTYDPIEKLIRVH